MQCTLGRWSAAGAGPLQPCSAWHGRRGLAARLPAWLPPGAHPQAHLLCPHSSSEPCLPCPLQCQLLVEVIDAELEEELAEGAPASRLSLTQVRTVCTACGVDSRCEA